MKEKNIWFCLSAVLLLVLTLSSVSASHSLSLLQAVYSLLSAPCLSFMLPFLLCTHTRRYKHLNLMKY